MRPTPAAFSSSLQADVSASAAATVVTSSLAATRPAKRRRERVSISITASGSSGGGGGADDDGLLGRTGAVRRLMGLWRRRWPALELVSHEPVGPPRR
jgi:hypothetical protein